jgi:beta-galactosidase
MEGINPHPLLWGEAPALVRTTLTPGAIKIMARLEYPGGQTPIGDTLVLQSVPTSIPSVYEEKYIQHIRSGQILQASPNGPSNVTKEEKQKMLKKVEKDQTALTPGKG